MSVRATGRLIGDVVVASGLANSAKMIVQSVDEEKKQVTTIWFSDNHAVQTGIFPVGALDRLEQKVTAVKKAKAGTKKPASRK
jgi:tRNA U34 2-thiouridine synthase MnmA/TrmU